MLKTSVGNCIVFQLLFAIFTTLIPLMCCQEISLYAFNKGISSADESNHQKFGKVNKAYVLRNSHLGVNVYPNFNIILACVADLLVYWERREVTIITDDAYFASGSARINVVEWFKSKGIHLIPKLITSLEAKEMEDINEIMNKNRHFIVLCKTNITAQLIKMGSRNKTNSIIKRWIVVNSMTLKALESLSPIEDQIVLVSLANIETLTYEHLLHREINLFHVFFTDETNNWDMIKFAIWSANKRLYLLSDFDEQDKDTKMKGQILKAASIIFEGNKEDASCVIKSASLQLLTENLNVKFKCVTPKDRVYGTEINGTFNGIIGMLQTGEGDVSTSALYMLANRIRIIRYISPISVNTLSMWYRPANGTVSPVAHILAFSWTTWAMAALSIGIMAIILAFAFIRINGVKSRKPSMTNNSIFKWIITGEMILDILNKMPGTSNKFLTGIFYVWVFMMFAHYTSVLKSFLIYKNHETLFSTIEDIVQEGKDYRVLLLKGAIMQNYFMTSDKKIHHQLMQRVGKNPDNLLPDYSKLPEILCNEKAVFLEMNYRLDIELSGEASTKVCYLVNKPQTHFRQWQLTAFRKDFPYENIFKTRLLKAYESGLTKRNDDKSVAPPGISSDNMALTMNHMLTPIIALNLGIICSLIAMVIERLTTRKKMKGSLVLKGGRT